MKILHILLLISMGALFAGCATTRQAPQDTYTYLSLSGDIDGSEKVTFTDDGVQWKHLHWSPPADVKFQGVPWNYLKKSPPKWDEFADYDLSRASIVKRSGRDVIALERLANGFALYLVDSPNGSAPYSVTIAIPRKAAK
jgi:hypothetical protein